MSATGELGSWAAAAARPSRDTGSMRSRRALLAPEGTAVGYFRVSTVGQVDRYGLAAQRDDVREFCESAGLELVAELPERGVSGTLGLADRPALMRALDVIADGRAAGLVVARLDRLARELTTQEAILTAVWQLGGRVWSADSGEVPQDDPSDPMRTFIRQVMGAVAQLDRGMTVARMRAGKAAKRATAGDGAYLGGEPRYGARPDGQGDLAPDPAEAEAVARIAELRAGGMSLRGIAAALESEGWQPREGRRWHPQTVARIVRRGAVGEVRPDTP